MELRARLGEREAEERLLRLPRRVIVVVGVAGGGLSGVRRRSDRPWRGCRRRDGRGQPRLQRVAVFVVEAPAPRVGIRQEVVDRERLQRVRNDQPLARGGTRCRRQRRRFDGRGGIVEQFRDQDRRWNRRVVAHAASGVAQVQPLAGGEEQVEEDVALVDAALPVAAARIARHQVELGGTLRRGKCAIVQPQHADEPVRQIAQAGHRRERDGAAGDAAARRIVERGLQRDANHVRGDGLAHPAMHHGGVQRADAGRRFALVVDFVACRREEPVDDGEQRLPPFGRRLRPGDLVVQPLELADKFAKAAERERRGAFRIAGRDAIVQRSVGRCGQRIAEEQPIEAVAEAVAANRRQVERLAMVAVDAPANT